MSKIKVLDDLTIQKIAAGEVIENPASIVKELIENSIDAKSDKITIDIKKGGKESLRITDNGHGMTKEDLKLAFKRHSTSKLSEIEDIYNIMSLGFRGEALASISSVAKMKVLTKTEASDVGSKAIVREGKIQSLESVGTPIGTTMIVDDIFYNLPVRKKFMKSDMTEGNYISNIVTRLALGNKQVSFKFIRDNKIALQTTKTDNLKNTIYTVLGKDVASNIIKVDYKDEYIKLKGYIGNNSLYRGNRGHQYLYINGRYVENPPISREIENKYKTLIPINRFPVYVLMLEIDPQEVDVNIHPTKQEVKFTNPNRVINTVGKIINETLVPSLSIPKMEINRKEKKEREIKEESKLPSFFSPQKKDTITKDEYKILNIMENETEDFSVPKVRTFKSKGSPSKGSEKKEKYNIENEEPYNPDYYGKQEFKNNNKNKIKLEDVKINHLIDETFSNKIEKDNKSYEELEVEEQKIDSTLLDINPIGRIFNTYIIAESRDKEKVYFVDQHAAHERINFEKYKKEFENEKVVVQQLMFPEIIEFTSDEMEKYKENKDIFKKLGFDTEEFGPNSVALRGVPMLFGNPESKNLFLDVFDNMDNQISSNYDMKIEKIMKIACVNSIKSGDKIGDKEILALFEDLLKCEKPYTCPHGRPTIIEMSQKEMEKEFLRIV